MPDDVQNVVAQIDKEPAPAAPAAETPASTAPIDPDDAEVAAALAAVEAEAKGTPATPAAPAAPAAQTPTPAMTSAAAPQTPATPQAPQGEGEPTMIPKARLDEVLGKSSAKDLEIARLQGENQALRMVTKPAAPGASPAQQQQAPSLDQQVSNLRGQQDALAKKFDDGEIAMAEFNRENRKLEDQVFALREQALVEKARPAHQPQQASTAPDMRLEEKFDELESQHPYLKAPEVMRDDRWQFLLTEAADQLRAEGVVFADGLLPARQRFQLSERVAQLSDTYGPIWGAKAPAQQPSAPAAKPGLSPQGQARANKLEAAAAAPPDINRLTPQGGQAEYTEDMVANMTDDEILALPSSVRARFSPSS